MHCCLKDGGALQAVLKKNLIIVILKWSPIVKTSYPKQLLQSYTKLEMQLELASASPERDSKIKKAVISSSNSPPKLAQDHALALLINENLSSNQYNIIRDQKNHRCTLCPPDYVVKEVKRLCYPKDVPADVSAKVLVQSLICHRIKTLYRDRRDSYSFNKR